MLFLSQIFTHLKTNHIDGVLCLTLDNPETSNAITSEMITSFTTALKHADEESSVRAVVVRGSGNSFCSGGDIKAMQSKLGMFAGSSNDLRLQYIRGIQQIPKAIENFSKPLIAMVNGSAIGAGCDLAMMCDIRVGSPKSKFGETFTKLGLVPGDGGSFFLQRVVGYAKAMEMSLTGDIIEGEEAKACGLLNYLVSAQDLETETHRLAVRIAENPPIAVQMTKKMLKTAYLHDVNAVLDLAAAYQGIAQRTEDHFAAVKAMVEKTKSQF